MALLDDLIARFSKTTATFAPSHILDCAIAKAHADMSRRATGHNPAIQAESVAWLKQHFTTNPPFGCTTQSAFDKWHQDTCEDYRKHMNSKSTFFITYGRAQKVLNMTFKYLYCTATYKAQVEKIIPFLHMTLDGYTLRWYKEVVIKHFNDHRGSGVPKLNVGDVSDWSKMNEVGKHSYADIQNRIRDYLHSATSYQYTINTSVIDEGIDDPKQTENTIAVEIPFDPSRTNPFFAEFIVWEGEIVRTKIDSLLKALNSTYANWADTQWAVNNAVTSDLKTKLSILCKSI